MSWRTYLELKGGQRGLCARLQFIYQALVLGRVATGRNSAFQKRREEGTSPQMLTLGCCATPRAKPPAESSGDVQDPHQRPLMFA